MHARCSPGHFAAYHVLHRLLAPRHPPRALCSLTSLSNQPNGLTAPPDGGSDGGEARDLYLCRNSRQKLKIKKKLITSSLVKVRRPLSWPAIQRCACSAVRWSVTSSSWLKPTDQGISVWAAHKKTTRGLSSRPMNSRCSCEILWGLPDIQLVRSCSAQLCRSAMCLLSGESGGDEETRTPDPLLAKEMLFQLSYVPLPLRHCCWRKVVGVSGLEPETSALSGQCSNQLS